MTLNSEGLEKALPCAFCRGEIFLGEVQKPDGIGGWKKSGYQASCRSCEMSMKEAVTEVEAIAAWNRRALPPVDGLEVVAWVDAGTIDISWEKKIVATNPEYVQRNGGLGQFQPLVTLSQASSVIAGLTAEVADLRDEWQAEYDARLAANTARRAAEARTSSLEEENKRLREALAFYRDGFSFKTNKRYGGLEWHPTEALLDDCGNAARQALEDHNG